MSVIKSVLYTAAESLKWHSQKNRVIVFALSKTWDGWRQCSYICCCRVQTKLWRGTYVGQITCSPARLTEFARGTYSHI